MTTVEAAPHADRGRSDPASMRRGNLSLVLRHLRDGGGSSRARLATLTGLSKATTSALVADLVARGLVVEGPPERAGAVGRPGLMVDLHGGTVCGVGLEVNVDYLSLIALDLRGEVVRQETRPIDAARLPVAHVTADIAGLLAGVLGSVRAEGRRVVGVTLAAPGFVERGSGLVRLAPNLGWRDVSLARDVARRLGPHAPPVEVENDAKLGGVAEYALAAGSGVEDLLYVTGDVGVGGGIMAAGRILRGANGFAGEIGHMPLDPAMRQCACGRRGCWETMVGLAAFLRLAAADDDVVRDPNRPLEDRLRELQRRAAAADPRTTSALATVAEGLGTGVSILVDVLNPARVVLGGYFAWFGDELVDPVARLVEQRRLNTTAEVCSVVGSTLGLTSAARGAAHYSLERVFQDPTTVSA